MFLWPLQKTVLVKIHMRAANFPPILLVSSSPLYIAQPSWLQPFTVAITAIALANSVFVCDKLVMSITSLMLDVQICFNIFSLTFLLFCAQICRVQFQCPVFGIEELLIAHPFVGIQKRYPIKFSPSQNKKKTHKTLKQTRSLGNLTFTSEYIKIR